jgi:hypothetical protein
VLELFETPAVYIARYTPFNDTNALVAVPNNSLPETEDEGLVSKASSLQATTDIAAIPANMYLNIFFILSCILLNC